LNSKEYACCEASPEFWTIPPPPTPEYVSQPITVEKPFNKVPSTLKSGQDVFFLVCPNGQGRSGSNVFVAGTLP
jgi:hypothetical protein